MPLCETRTCRCGCIAWCLAAGISGCGQPPTKSTEIQPNAKIADQQAPAMQVSTADWPMWRGPNEDGVSANSTVPTHWSETENVVWRAAIPGRGHSSPIIVGDRIYLETADEQRQLQLVLCLNRSDGSQAWQTEIHRGHMEKAMHQENTQASSTIASDGERLFALFLHDQKIKATALDLDGKIVWQVDVGPFKSKFGYSASPVLFENVCLIAADHSGGGFIAAIHRETGEIVWRKPRDRGDSYASPRVITLGGNPQVILGGTRKVVSYDPLTGVENWSTPGTADADVGTAVSAGDLVVVSGGYPEAETIAVGPNGKVAWRKKEKSYVPSLLAHDGYVYLANDDGVVICWEAASGKENWKQRIGGNFRVSPILVGGNIYITDMSAKTTVFKATPEGYEAIAENLLGTEAFASPAVSRDQLFLRVAHTMNGIRQETLYCLGNTAGKVSRN